MFEISKIAYELYVQNWIDEHTTPELRLQNIREYYSYVRECLVDEIEPDTYKDWLSEYGFNGSLCVCYEEFCDMEYHDKDYIRYLLGEDNELIEMYYQDIEDYLEEEALELSGKDNVAGAEQTNNSKYAPWQEYSLSKDECDNFVEKMMANISGIGVDEGSGYFGLKSFELYKEHFNLYCEISKEQEDGDIRYVVYHALEFDEGDNIWADWAYTETLNIDELKVVVFDIANLDYTNDVQRHIYGKAISDYYELNKIVEEFQGSFEDLCVELSGQNYDGELFDVYFGVLSVTVYNSDNARWISTESIDILNESMTFMIEERISLSKLKEICAELGIDVDNLSINNEKETDKNKFLNKGAVFYVSGDSCDMGIEDYNVRVSAYAEVIEQPNQTDKKVLVCLDNIDGDCNVIVYINKQALKEHNLQKALSCEDTIENEKKYFEASLVNYDDNNVDKYAIAKEVDLENFKNALECIDYNPEDYTEKELSKMVDSLSDKLANDDTYNAIYNEALEEVIKEYEKAKETNLEKTIDKAIADAEAKSKQQENNDKTDIDLEI